MTAPNPANVGEEAVAKHAGNAAELASDLQQTDPLAVKADMWTSAGETPPLDAATYSSLAKAAASLAAVPEAALAAESAPPGALHVNVAVNTAPGVEAAAIIVTESPRMGTQAGVGGDAGTESRSTPQQTPDVRASSAEKTGGAFQRLIASRTGQPGTSKQAGSSQEAMIDKIMKFTRGPRKAGHIRMTLNPPKLGTLHMDIRVKDGLLSVACRTENPAARAMLLGGADGLRAALGAEDLGLGEFSVSVEHGKGEADQRHDGSRRGPAVAWETPAEVEAGREVLTAGSVRVLVDVTA
jgi:hypothetical protein